MTDTVLVALLSLVGTLVGTYTANRKSTALITYRLEQLENKVNTHNQVIERTYKLEERDAVMQEQIRVANHRIEDLEKFHK
jgi:sensor histidine kinase YesM